MSGSLGEVTSNVTFEPRVAVTVCRAATSLTSPPGCGQYVPALRRYQVASHSL